jgi:hypothetical protein
MDCLTAEVTSVALTGDEADAAKQFDAFAKKYFTQFNKTPFGMIRQDPQVSIRICV